MPKRAAIRFFIDHNVPVSVGETLRDLGYEVIFLRDVLPTDSPDPLVAQTAQIHNAVLVSLDRDFDAKRAAKQIGAKHKTLSRVLLKCVEPDAPKRIVAALSLIEAEWRLSHKRSATYKRMIVEVMGVGIKTIR